MVPGFNHNIKHKGKLYHIQTEDSGVDNPHIITLLYHAGTIISKKKTSYADIVQMQQLPQLVKELMEEQHKAMLRDLVKGGYDKGVSVPSAKLASEEPIKFPLEPANLPSAKPPVQPIKESQPAAKPLSTSIGRQTPALNPLEQGPTIDASEIASLFGSGKTEEGERSLDEIILGYLADENS